MDTTWIFTATRIEDAIKKWTSEAKRQRREQRAERKRKSQSEREREIGNEIERTRKGTSWIDNVLAAATAASVS